MSENHTSTENEYRVAALKREREGYERFGKTDRLKAVNAEIERLTQTPAPQPVAAQTTREDQTTTDVGQVDGAEAPGAPTEVVDGTTPDVGQVDGAEAPEATHQPEATKEPKPPTKTASRRASKAQG